MKAVYVTVFLVSISLICGCSTQFSASGEWNKIVVFAHDNDWNVIAQSTKSIFERIIHTPQEEKMYEVYHPPFENFKTFDRRRFVIIAGTLETPGLIGNFIQSVVIPGIESEIEAGTYIFTRENQWADKQVAVFLIAPDIQKLQSVIEENAERLYRIIDDSRNRYIKTIMYEKKEQVKLSKRILDDYNFTIRIQHGYQIARENPEEKYIWLRRFRPDRMIFIHWVDTTNADIIPENWVVAKREFLAKNFIDNAVIDSKTFTVKQTLFLDYYAVELRGFWMKKEASIGGPLINYTFFDDETSRIYMIDLMLLAPEYPAEKELYIRQLEIIARTFTTKNAQSIQ